MMFKAAVNIEEEAAGVRRVTEEAAGVRSVTEEEEEEAAAGAGRLHELVVRAAARHGTRTAVCYESEADGARLCYTYSQVTCLGNTLKELLYLHCDFSQSYVIGLYCQPTVNLPSCILGILHTGAAFCPINPECSPRLSAHFMQRCKMMYILIQKDMIQQFRDLLSTWLYIDVEYDIPKLYVVLVKIQWQVTNMDSLAPEPRNKENVIYSKIRGLKEGSLETTEEHKKKHAHKYVDCQRRGFVAYILQTSGTTGTPKIVRVPHQCIVPNIQHLKSIFEISSDDVIFMASPLTFDPSIVEMFVALCSGATLLIVPPVVKMMPKRLNKVLFNDHKVSVLQATPTLIKRFGSEILASVVLSANTSLRVLALGGEAFPSLCVLKSWRGEGNKTQIFNLYGITEVSSWATYYRIPEEILCNATRHEECVPLGFPLLGTTLDVMDNSGQVIQEGEGQVFIGKIDQTTLIQTYREKTKAKISNNVLGKKELWEGIQRLWKVVLNLPEGLPDVSENCMFLYSGGDSLKALRLTEEIETLVGQTVFGLAEVILNSSLLDIYNHIIEAIFFETKNNEELNDKNDRKIKRKRIKDESARSHSKQIKQWRSTASIGNITTVSRGSQITKLNTNVSYENCENRPDVQEGKDLMDAESNGEERKGHNSSNVSENVNANMSINEEKMSVKNNSWESFVNKVVKPQRNDGKVIPEDRVANCTTVSLKIRWKSDTAKCVDASPLLVISENNGSDATLYIGSHSHRIQAIDVLSGKIKWERILGDRIESSACISRCGKFIIVGCYDGSVCVLKGNDGETFWIFCTGNSVKSSPIVDPDLGLVFVGSHDQHIYALDILDKACVWKLHCGGGAVFSTPCLNKSPRLLYVATLGESLVAVNPDTGSVVWKRSCGKPLFSSPQCTSQSVYIGCVDGSLQCFSHNGDQFWQFSTGGPIFSSPCIYSFSATNQKIICGSYDCFVYCLNEDGDLVWKFETSNQVYAVPFVFTNCDLNDRTLVAVISTDGNLWILVATTGELVTSYSLPGEVFSSPVVWKETLIVGCRNNYVYCLEMSTSEQKKMALGESEQFPQ
uniref:beta-alanine-activating enzyme isoform X2 n=1 Tax=Pristiophorus japonicus TaxID=55135 RepID=UPI00398F2FC6